jgi:hypothetical protein
MRNAALRSNPPLQMECEIAELRHAHSELVNEIVDLNVLITATARDLEALVYHISASRSTVRKDNIVTALVHVLANLAVCKPSPELDTECLHDPRSLPL